MLARFGIHDASGRQPPVADRLPRQRPRLSDEEWLEIKFRGLLVLLFTLPEFQVH